MRYAVPAVLLVVALITWAGCKKIEEKVLLKGVFQLNSFYLEGSEDNFMRVALDGYDEPEGCCTYLIDFQDDGDAFGFYYRNDTLDYVVRGEWELKAYHELYINLDDYVNGTFDVDRQGKKKFQLTTNENTIILGGIPNVFSLEMNISRE